MTDRDAMIEAVARIVDDEMHSFGPSPKDAAASILAALEPFIAAREQAAREELQRRLNWAANELLACDYGENETGEIGWVVYGWRTKGNARIYGPSIDEAIDRELLRNEHREQQDG